VVTGEEKQPVRPADPTRSSGTDTAMTSEQAAAILGIQQYDAWTKKAKKARKMILSTISPSVMTYVEGTRDPAEMWSILEGRYKPKSNFTLRQLQRQFNTMKMVDDDGNMEKHLQQIERLKRQIEEQGEKVSESNYISILLNCAPPRYDIQISILEAQDDVTSTIIINRLLEEYRKFLVTNSPEEKKLAMLANGKRTNQRGGKPRAGGGDSSPTSKFDGKCNHCNKRGHKETQCWIKHPELKPEKGRRNDQIDKPKYAMMATSMTNVGAAPK